MPHTNAPFLPRPLSQNVKQFCVSVASFGSLRSVTQLLRHTHIAHTVLQDYIQAISRIQTYTDSSYSTTGSYSKLYKTTGHTIRLRISDIQY